MRATVGTRRACTDERSAKDGGASLTWEENGTVRRSTRKIGTGTRNKGGRYGWASQSGRSLGLCWGWVPTVQTAHLDQVEEFPAISWRHVLSPGGQKLVFHPGARGLLKRRLSTSSVRGPRSPDGSRRGCAGPVCRLSDHARCVIRGPCSMFMQPRILGTRRLGICLSLARTSPRQHARPLRGSGRLSSFSRTRVGRHPYRDAQPTFRGRSRPV